MLEELLNSSLPIVITAIGGVVAYAVQKSIDRKNTIASMRRDFYSEFLDTWLMRHTGKSDPDIDSTYSRLRLRLYVVSSDEVIRAFFEVSSYLDKIGRRALSVEEANDLKKLLAKLILYIRKDCYEKSDLHVDEVTRYMPIGGAIRKNHNNGN
tara:strand:+ start:844 stop:1302 length:459 start_codon:yes stop_codon:yes gene_type:complete